MSAIGNTQIIAASTQTESPVVTEAKVIWKTRAPSAPLVELNSQVIASAAQTSRRVAINTKRLSGKSTL